MVYCKIHFSAVYGVSGFAVEICGLICCNPTPNNYPCASIFSIVRQCKSPWYLFRFCSSTADAQISLIWCFLLDALQFMIRMVESVYLDWNYPFVHRRSPSPWRELPWEPVPVPTSDLRAEARRLQPAAAIQSRGPDPNKIADFYAVFHAHAHALPARRACSDRAATYWHNGQQPRSHGEPAATAPQTHRDCKSNAQKSSCNRRNIFTFISVCI